MTVSNAESLIRNGSPTLEPVDQPELIPPPALPRIKPYLVIAPRSGWAALDIKEVWQYRGLLWTLAKRELKVRYKQTALGVVWVVLQPLLAAGIFAFVFGKVAKFSGDGLPYFVFSFAGLLAWNVFGQTLNKASASLVSNAQLISKVYFPRLVLPLSTVLSTLIDFAVASILMVFMMIEYGIRPGPGIALIPVWLALLVLLALGLGLLSSALMVSYRDLRQVIPVMLQFLLYASPVAYAVTAVPERYRTLFLLNPIAGILEAFRWSLLGRGELSLLQVGYSAAVSVVVFVIGAFAFKRMERKFADVI